MTRTAATGSTMARAQTMLKLAAGQVQTPYGATLAQPFVHALAQLTGDVGLQRAIASKANSSVANALMGFSADSTMTVDIAAALSSSDFPGSAQYQTWLADADCGLIVGGQTLIPALHTHDQGMLRTVDLMMATGEIATKVNPEFFSELHTEIVDKGLDDQGLPERLTKRKRVGPTVRTAFADLLRRLEDDNSITLSVTWDGLVEELSLYWLVGMGDALKDQTTSFSSQMQFTVKVQRALQRAVLGGATEDQLAELLATVDSAFFTVDTHATFMTFDELQSLWERAHAYTDPLEIFRPIDQTMFDEDSPFRTLPRRYLRAALAGDNAHHRRIRKLMTALTSARARAIERPALERLRDILTDPELGIARRTRDLQRETPTPEQPTQPFIALTRHTARGREVVWNPFASTDPTVMIHPGMGQGNIHLDDFGDPIRKNDMVFASFRGQKPGFTYESRLIFATQDPEGFVRRADDRAAKFPHYPPASAALLLRRLMPDFIDMFSRYVADKDMRSTFFAAVLPDIIAEQAKRTWRHAVLTSWLTDYSRLIGMDAIALALRLFIGETPTVVTESEGIRLDNFLTPDLFPAFLRTRAWQREWRQDDMRPRVPNAAWAGMYYTQTFHGPRDHDLMPLYLAYRDGDPTATQQVTDLLRPLVAEWMTANTVEGEDAPIVIPIPGCAPNGTVAAALGYPTVTPWFPRPENYGAGVEGKTAMNKWRIVDGAMQLDPTYVAQIAGRRVLFIDDNITDGITYMLARKRVLEAGARAAGIVVLTRSVRSPSELDFMLL